MRLRLVSSNARKVEEVVEHLASRQIDALWIRARIDEVQSPDMDVIIEDKSLRAFNLVGRPLLVEHTGFNLEALGGFPGGLSQMFWDRLAASRVCELFGEGGAGRAQAVTAFGYCDGKRIWIFRGTLDGTIAATPAGPATFGWDCVFVPEGEARTLAEMGSEKAIVSMRIKALEGFLEHLGRTAC